MSDRVVFLKFGVDRSAVYHVTRDCPALTGSGWSGWPGEIVEAKLNDDGSQTVMSGGVAQGTPQRRRSCKRCAT